MLMNSHEIERKKNAINGYKMLISQYEDYVRYGSNESYKKEHEDKIRECEWCIKEIESEIDRLS